MKKLLLIRHASAVSPSYASDDFGRILSEEGLEGANNTARKLKDAGLVPQLIVSSPSSRTKQTTHIIAQALEIPRYQFIDEIYEASEQALLNIINHFDNTYNFIALTGHNPGISYLLLNLTGEVREVSPGTAILITFDVDEWSAIISNTGSISFYTSPQH